MTFQLPGWDTPEGRDALVEAVARSICTSAGIFADMMITEGPPFQVTSPRGCAFYGVYKTDGFPAWQLYRQAAEDAVQTVRRAGEALPDPADDLRAALAPFARYGEAVLEIDDNDPVTGRLLQVSTMKHGDRSLCADDFREAVRLAPPA
jgi:hypothetical protein